jgi:hypothetical protein
MNLYLDDTLVTVEELSEAFLDLGETDVIELVRVDDEGNLWFEVNAYGVRF